MKKTIEITMELSLPDDLQFTDETLKRWIEFHVASWGGIPVSDPLCERDPVEFLTEIFVAVD